MLFLYFTVAYIINVIAKYWTEYEFAFAHVHVLLS